MPSDTPPAIMWFRQDLRLTDNPAFRAAVEAGPVIPVYILDEKSDNIRALGGAHKWWLHHSLERLNADLAQHHTPLVLRRGAAAEILEELVEATGAKAVFWNRVYDKPRIERDKAIKGSLKDQDLTVETFNGSLLFEPWEVSKDDGTFYRVFTPFWKAATAQIEPRKPHPAPESWHKVDQDICSDTLESWNLLPTQPDWAEGFRETWQVGEGAATQQLEAFIEDNIDAYKDLRDRPDLTATSRLSPHLHWGEISPHQVWHTVSAKSHAKSGDISKGAWSYLREIGWREFSFTLLYYFPDIDRVNIQEKFNDFPWVGGDQASQHLKAWQRGQTGYPIVDAGMRELWHTGWMHNRVRMIVGSFLVKHLLIDWREGERWFWDTLVDGDHANNTASWQWVAGCGADAAPYFRVFNPIIQARKFDPNGDYIRRWCPELKDLETKHLAAPWEASTSDLQKAGIQLGETYPAPLVEHGAAREKALAAFEAIKQD